MGINLKIILSLIALAIFTFLRGGILFAETVEDNYKLYCTQCHGVKGDGKGVNVKDMSVQPKNHTSAADMSKLKDDEMFQAIKNGGAAISKSTLMPPWGSVLKDDEITALVKYMHKLCNC